MNPPISPDSLLPRFVEKFEIDTETSCWLWTASLHPQGYGAFWLDGQMRLAHKVSWETVNGTVPAGLELDHLCRVRRCCNPTHLEPVTRRENSLRGVGPATVSAKRRAITHCKHGHPFSGENLRWTPEGRRRCRQCCNDNAARYRERQRSVA